MAQIRNTIELLSRIFRENGTSRIKAETFRLSKFNKEEAVPPLWKLLFELIYYCEYGKIDDVSVKACGELSQAEMVVFVKRELQKRGFYSRDFAALPDDMSQGSREILLALGWLLCKENIFTKFMDNCTSPLEDESAVVQGEGPFTSATANQWNTQPSLDPSQRVQQLLWLNNKLRLSLRTLHAVQRERTRLQHRVHEATQGVSLHPDRNHLSMLEVYMLRHPELLKKNLQLLEKDNERLQNLLKWKEHEDIFWKWMESVLDAKLQNRTSPPVEEAEFQGSSKFNASMETASQLSESHLNLQEAITKYESIVEHLERLWQEKSSEVTEDELDTVLSSIDLELSIQRTNIALNNCHNYVHAQYQEPTFILQRKKLSNRPTLHAVSNTPQSSTDNSADALDIQNEIDRLQEHVNGLQQEVDQKQSHFRNELQQLGARFRDAICIPPMGSKTSVIC